MKRWGRAARPHPPMRPDGDGGWLMSSRVLSAMLVTSETTVRRRLTPRGRDESTGALLYSRAEAEALWPLRPDVEAHITRSVT